MGSNSRGLRAEDEKFYAAMIDRENRQRLGWFLRHGGHLVQQQEQQLLHQAKKNEATEKAKRNKLGHRVEKGKEENNEMELMSTDVMRPVDENVRQLIYSGTSHMGEGRKKYLETRYEKSPKEKFYFKESKNWEYGWGVDGSNVPQVHSAGEAKHGRVAVVLASFYRRAGVESDPPHYREPVNMDAPFPLPLI